MSKAQGPLHIKINLKNFIKFPLFSKDFFAEIHRDKKEKRSRERSRAEVEIEAGRRVQKERKKEDMAKKVNILLFIIKKTSLIIF